MKISQKAIYFIAGLVASLPLTALVNLTRSNGRLIEEMTQVKKSSISKNSGISAQPQHTTLNSGIKTNVSVSSHEPYLNIPISRARDLLRPQIGVDLMPTERFLQHLGLDATHISGIIVAFSEFKKDFETLEAQNARLIQKAEGEFYEIPPFDGSPLFTKLSSSIATILGPDDWRSNLLLESLKHNSLTAGLGKFRQEVAIEEAVDSGGGKYHLIKAKYFDANNNEIDFGGFQVTSQEELKRYGSIFQFKQ